jgi:outer membrane protein
MKNLSLILNAILLIAVAFLFYKIYSGDKQSAGVTIHALPSSSIVFVNSDSLLDHYDFFNSLKDKIQGRQDSIDHILTAKAKELDSKVQVYQKQAIGMTDMEKQMTEEKLMQEQQRLVQMKETLMGMLSEEESAMNDSIHNHLVGYLHEFNKSKGYNFILGYQKGGGILLANDSLDITGAVLEGLNKK